MHRSRLSTDVDCGRGEEAAAGKDAALDVGEKRLAGG